MRHGHVLKKLRFIALKRLFVIGLKCAAWKFICFFVNHSVRPGHVLRKPSFIALMRLVVFGLNSMTQNYFARYGLVFWARILFTACFDCFLIRGTSHITVCLLLVPFNICLPLFMNVNCFGLF